MIVASKLPSGLDIGGFVLKPAMIGHEEHQQARASGRERIAGYEITRDVPRHTWECWFADNQRSALITRKLVAGFEDGDEQGLSTFCWENQHVRGWMQAPQDGSMPARGIR